MDAAARARSVFNRILEIGGKAGELGPAERDRFNRYLLSAFKDSGIDSLEELVKVLGEALSYATNPEAALGLTARRLDGGVVRLCNGSRISYLVTGMTGGSGFRFGLLDPGDCLEGYASGDRVTVTVEAPGGAVVEKTFELPPPGTASPSPGYALPRTPPAEASLPPLPVAVPGFKPVEKCRGAYTTVMHRPLVPEGYEGRWACCLLGCGGWGYAYKCDRDGRTLVFKVSVELRDIVEMGKLPTATLGQYRGLGRIAGRARDLAVLRHPHILRLLGYSERAPLLIYEYADMGTLQDQLAEGWEPGLERPY